MLSACERIFPRGADTPYWDGRIADGETGLIATIHCWIALAMFPGGQAAAFSLDLLVQRGLKQVNSHH